MWTFGNEKDSMIPSNIYFYICGGARMHMCVCICVCLCICVGVSVCCVCGVPWSWSYGQLWATQCVCWEQNLGPLEELTLLSTKTSLYTLAWLLNAAKGLWTLSENRNPYIIKVKIQESNFLGSYPSSASCSICKFSRPSNLIVVSVKLRKWLFLYYRDFEELLVGLYSSD